MKKDNTFISALIATIIILTIGMFLLAYLGNKYDSQNNTLKSKLAIAISEKKDIAKELETCAQQKEKLQEQLGLSRENLSACFSAKQKLTETAKNFNKLIKMADKQKIQLIQEIQYLRESEKELTKKLQELIRENKAARKKLAESRARISALKKELAQKSAELSDDEIQSRINQGEIESLQTDLVAQEESAKQDRANFMRANARLAAKLKQAKCRLAEQNSDLGLLVKNNARQRLELKAEALRLGRIKSITKKLSKAITELNPRMIAKIYFATGEWRLNNQQKDYLNIARALMKNCGDDYFPLVKGTSDRQPFPNNSKLNNSVLSISRALAVEKHLLQTQETPPIAIMGLSNILAPAAEPADNPKERAAALYIVKKYPPDLGGLMASLRRCLRDEK